MSELSILHNLHTIYVTKIIFLMIFLKRTYHIQIKKKIIILYLQIYNKNWFFKEEYYKIYIVKDKRNLCREQTEFNIFEIPEHSHLLGFRKYSESIRYPHYEPVVNSRLYKLRKYLKHITFT